MPGVFREVDIDWKGETYTVTPSLALLRRVEAQEISIPHLLNMMASGRPQPAQIATLTAALLREGGATVTDDEIYAELMAGDPSDVEALTLAIFHAVAPAVDEKKPEARGSAAGKRKPKSKKSTGQRGS